MTPVRFIVLSSLLAGLGCKADSSAGRAAQTIRDAFSPAPLPPDTIPEMLNYAADLQVNIAEMAKLPEGVLWADLEVGSGDSVVVGDSVQVALAGWLPDGTLVDSSTTALRLGQGTVIQGLDLGIPGMKTGGRRQLVIPPGLAFGAEGGDNIPANAVLVYLVDLKARLP